MKKAILVILPIIFTAQACNFLFGDLYGDQGSGNRGVYSSVDGAATWQAANTTTKKGGLNGTDVSRVVVEQGDPSNILLTTQNQGVFGSDTSGEKWIQLLPDFSAYDAAVNPLNPEEIFVAGAKNKLAAVYKSPDRAGTWVQVYSEPAGPSVVTSLLLDTKSSGVIYGGLSTGAVIKSVDGGETWKVVANFKDRVMTLVAGFDSVRTLYALTRSAGLHRSSDAGKTWSKVVITEESKIHYDIGLDKKNPSAAYVATDKGLFATSDDARTWSKLSLPASPQFNSVTAVAVNPDNSQQVIAAIRSTIYRSDDRGATWRTANLPTRRTVYSISINPLEPNRVYVGVR